MSRAANLAIFASNPPTSNTSVLYTGANVGIGTSTPTQKLSVNGSISVTNNVTVTGDIVPSSSYLRNRIINGDMRIDQRNAGAQITAANLTNETYMVDRWKYQASQAAKFTAQQNAGAVTSAVGFPNYLGMTVATAVTVGASDYFHILQAIEGFNFADLAWGTASAKTVTLSFVVYSSLTGTFGGALRNSVATRSYPFTYSIPTANTWTTISVTIAGDTSGTWVGATNGIGVQVGFGLGVGSTYSGTAGAWSATNYVSATGAVSVVGTSGATFYITGVQLEVGSNATPFERRMYGQELALCQRYYERSYEQGTATGAVTTNGSAQLPIGASASIFQGIIPYVEKRAQPTLTFYDCAGNITRVTAFSAGGAAQTDNNNVIATSSGGQRGGWIRISALAGGTAAYHWIASAEL